MKEKILELRRNGLSYREIQKELRCSKGTISFHCGDGQKEKTKNRLIRNRKNSIKTILSVKTDAFFRANIRHKRKNFINKDSEYINNIKELGSYFTPDDVINKFGLNPKCYLTGRNINLLDTKSYNFEHIIPVSRGGLSNLDNLGLACKDANIFKGSMTTDELINICKEILANNGYKCRHV